jgi:hypothetical protein
MSFNRGKTRPDLNQAEIVGALRQIGAKVWIIGSPVDLLTLYRGRWLPMEVKGFKARPRRDQEKQTAFIEQTHCPVVKTAAEAVEAICRP